MTSEGHRPKIIGDRFRPHGGDRGRGRGDRRHRRRRRRLHDHDYLERG